LRIGVGFEPTFAERIAFFGGGFDRITEKAGRTFARFFGSGFFAASEDVGGRGVEERVGADGGVRRGNVGIVDVNFVFVNGCVVSCFVVRRVVVVIGVAWDGVEFVDFRLRRREGGRREESADDGERKRRRNGTAQSRSPLENVEFNMLNSFCRVRSKGGASRRAAAFETSANVKLRETGKRYRRKITNFDDERNGNFSRRFQDEKI